MVREAVRPACSDARGSAVVGTLVGEGRSAEVVV